MSHEAFLFTLFAVFFCTAIPFCIYIKYLRSNIERLDGIEARVKNEIIDKIEWINNLITTEISPECHKKINEIKYLYGFLVHDYDIETKMNKMMFKFMDKIK